MYKYVVNLFSIARNHNSDVNFLELSLFSAFSQSVCLGGADEIILEEVIFIVKSSGNMS